MSEAQVSAPAPVPIAPAPVVEAPIQDAGLAAAVAAHSAKYAPAGEPAKVDAVVVEAPAVETAVHAATALSVETPVIPAKEEPEKDSPADRIGEYMRQTRAAKAAQKEAAEAKAKLAEEMERLKPYRELAELKARDPLAALRQAFGKELDETDLAVRALAGEKETTVELTDDERAELLAVKAAEIAEKKRLAAEAEAKKAKEAEDAQKEEASQAAYYAGVATELTKQAGTFPLLASEGIDGKEWDKALRGHHKATGKVPTFAMLAEHFEKKIEAQTNARYAILQKRNGVQVAPPAPIPSGLPVAAKAPVVATASAPVKVEASASYLDDRAARLAALREADRQRMQARR